MIIRTTTRRTLAVRYMNCCCCGDSTFGRQWHNQDTGYNLCRSCDDWEKIQRQGVEEMLKNYGYRGYHFDIPEAEETPEIKEESGLLIEVFEPVAKQRSRFWYSAELKDDANAWAKECSQNGWLAVILDLDQEAAINQAEREAQLIGLITRKAV